MRLVEGRVKMMDKISSSKRLLTFMVCLAAIIILSLPMLIHGPKTARAASLSDCVGSSGAASVPSIHSACGLCGGVADTTRRGALWINNSSSKDSAIVNANSSASTVSFNLWGQVYACGSSNTSAMNAYSIWFAEAGKMKDSDPRVDFITVSSRTMYRGSTSGIFTWSGGGYITGTIDLAKFKANPNTTCTDLGGGAQECTHTVSVNRCATNRTYVNTTGNQNPGTGCYGDDSVITLRLDGVDEDDEESDAHVYSQSTIKIDAQGDISSHDKKTTPDGSTSVLISTDQESVAVQFQHELHYIVDKGNYATADVFDEDIKVKYEILDKDDGVVHGEATWTISKPTNPKSNQELTSIQTETVTVSGLEPGVPKQVCRKITYKDKYYWFKTVQDEDAPGTTHATGHVKFHWGIDSSRGNEDSVVCVTITRAKDPGGTGPKAGGSADETIFFAGETAEIGWDVNASGVNVRRLTSKQAVVFNYSVEKSQDSATTGDSRYRGGTSGACNHYASKDGLRCSTLSDTALTDTITPPSPTYTSSAQLSDARRSIAVPDNVGWKYCTSYAYRFEYWYAYVEDGVISWTHEATKDYWFVYGAVCRAIAKKPSVAVWNSGLMTPGNIVTSLSPRFVSDNIMGKLYDDPSLTVTRILYGSWSEYLGVIGKSVNGFGSGSSLSVGGIYNANEHNFCNNHSHMTISNNDCANLGYSGVTTSSAYFTRIDAYLKKQSEPYTSLSALGTMTSGDTIAVRSNKIIHTSGKLRIDKNIVLEDTPPYESIYQLPRVIIFADEGVEITGNVTKIDAWIFTNGKVNTCVDFNKPGTEAVSVQNNGAIYNSPDCSKQLVFSGPVYAKDGVILNRHYGSDKSPNGVSGSRYTPAEVFNLRGDDYLWAYAQAGRYSSSYTEAYTRELAPRY